MIIDGQFIEAMEQFYHDQVQMRDNHRPACIGKAANLQREQAYVAGLIKFKTAKVLNFAVHDQVSMVEWHLHFTHQQLGEVNQRQVAVQRWQDGQIINEQFYYNEKKS